LTGIVEIAILHLQFPLPVPALKGLVHKGIDTCHGGLQLECATVLQLQFNDDVAVAVEKLLILNISTFYVLMIIIAVYFIVVVLVATMLLKDPLIRVKLDMREQKLLRDEELPFDDDDEE